MFLKSSGDAYILSVSSKPRKKKKKENKNSSTIRLHAPFTSPSTTKHKHPTSLAANSKKKDQTNHKTPPIIIIAFSNSIYTQ